MAINHIIISVQSNVTNVEKSIEISGTIKNSLQRRFSKNLITYTFDFVSTAMEKAGTIIGNLTIMLSITFYLYIHYYIDS